MGGDRDIAERIAGIRALLAERLGARGPDLARALSRARRDLPRRAWRAGRALARAETLAAHPRLRATLDLPALHAAARELEAALQAIDPADRRKGWWLGVAGGLAFNLLALLALLIVFLRWRGHV